MILHWMIKASPDHSIIIIIIINKILINNSNNNYEQIVENPTQTKQDTIDYI